MRALTIAPNGRYTDGNEDPSISANVRFRWFRSPTKTCSSRVKSLRNLNPFHTTGGCFVAVDEGSLQAGSVTVNSL